MGHDVDLRADPGLDDVLAVDAWARRQVLELAAANLSPQSINVNVVGEVKTPGRIQLRDLLGDIAAPRGKQLSCQSWLTEAAYRMIQNNLDPEVAENPDALVVYGGIGKAARNWDCVDAILTVLDKAKESIALRPDREAIDAAVQQLNEAISHNAPLENPMCAES